MSFIISMGMRCWCLSEILSVLLWLEINILCVLHSFFCSHSKNSQSFNQYFFSFCIRFRSLKCARITLHMHLFASFAANNFLWILWYRLIVGDPYVIQTYEVSWSVWFFLRNTERIQCKMYSYLLIVPMILLDLKLLGLNI